MIMKLNKNKSIYICNTIIAVSCIIIFSSCKLFSTCKKEKDFANEVYDSLSSRNYFFVMEKHNRDCKDFFVSDELKDTVYLIPDIKPKYQEGGSQLIKDLMKIVLEYPFGDSEIRPTTVHYALIIKKDGTAICVKANSTRNEFPDFDSYFIQKFAILKKWEPGKKDGKVINVYFEDDLFIKYNGL